MKFESTSIVHVYYNPEGYKQLVGKLALKNRKILFEYSTEFIKTGLELSPFKLPLKPGPQIVSEIIFEGLFGVFNDSLPDGWGRLLLDRKLVNLGLNPDALSPLDRLSFVGNHGMGALCYEPENWSSTPLLDFDLDVIAEEINLFQEKDDDRYIEDLINLGGSSAGARPKVLLHIDENDWIVKFRASLDSKDISNIEYAYHLMAIDAKLDVPEAKLFPSRQRSGFFGVKRFDRVNKQHIHMHTISGLLHADHRIPSLDYQTIMKATMHLTHDICECKKQFRNAVFNVLSHNRDDHAKNFSFLMDDTGTWKVSPAYDLTFSTGPFGEHCTTIMGEGKNPSLSNLLKLATVGNIKNDAALKIIEEVKKSVLKWDSFADIAHVTSASKKMIGETLKNSMQMFSKEL